MRITCSCGKVLQVRDDLAGKRVRCPGCGAALLVEEAAPEAVVAQAPKAAPAAKKMPRPPDDEPRPRRKDGAKGVSPLWLAAVGGVGAVGLAVLAVLFVRHNRKDDASEHAAGPSTPPRIVPPAPVIRDQPLPRPDDRPGLDRPPADRRPPDGGQPADQNLLDLPPRDAAAEAVRAAERAAKLAERGVEEKKIVEALRKTEAAKGAEGDELAVLKGHDKRVTALAFSPAGDLLAVAFDPNEPLAESRVPIIVKVWDLRTGKVRFVINIISVIIQQLTFSPDGRALAVACGDHRGADGLFGAVRLYDATTGAKSKEVGGHSGPVKGVVFSPDGRWFASMSADYQGPEGGKTLRLWRLPDATPAWTVSTPQDEAPRSIHFHPDSNVLVVLFDKGMRSLIDVDTGKRYRDSFPLVKSSTALALSPDGRSVAVSCGWAGGDGAAVLLGDVATGRDRVLDRGAEAIGTPVAIAFTPEGKKLITHDRYNFRTWDVEGAKMIKSRLSDVHFQDLATISPGGEMLAGASETGAVTIYPLPKLIEAAP